MVVHGSTINWAANGETLRVDRGGNHNRVPLIDRDLNKSKQDWRRIDKEWVAQLVNDSTRTIFNIFLI